MQCPAGQISELRQAIEKAESSKMNKNEVKMLNNYAKTIEKNMSATKNSADLMRMQMLAAILKQPAA